MDDPETRELWLDQAARERAEREQAQGAETPADEHTHERRAQRHTYLRGKLAERARAEDEADG
jgi:hypothetical protein